MAESPMLGARCPTEWAEQVKAIATATGRKEAEVVREAIGAYLGKHDPSAIRNTLEDVQLRLAAVEQKLGRLGRLISG